MTNFAGWLLSQADRPDPVGDLARDVQQDVKDGGLTGKFTPVRLRNRMIELNAIPEALDALAAARAEYLEGDGDA